MLSRRGFLKGIIAACAAPAIVRVASIMPVKVMPTPSQFEIWEYEGPTDHLFDAFRYGMGGSTQFGTISEVSARVASDRIFREVQAMRWIEEFKAYKGRYA